MQVKKSLTLLELLIVMAIIGILAVVAIPRYTGARLAAEHSKAQHNVALIAQAEKIVQIQRNDGNYVNTSSGSLNAHIGDHGSEASCRAALGPPVGANCSGIDLSAVDADELWSYSVSAAEQTITATKQDGRCSGGSFTYDLNENNFGDLSCP